MSTDWLNIRFPRSGGAGRGRSAAAVDHPAADCGRRLAHGDVRGAQRARNLGERLIAAAAATFGSGPSRSCGVALALSPAAPTHAIGIEVAKNRLAVGRLGVRGARLGAGDVLRLGRCRQRAPSPWSRPPAMRRRCKRSVNETTRAASAARCLRIRPRAHRAPAGTPGQGIKAPAGRPAGALNQIRARSSGRRNPSRPGSTARPGRAARPRSRRRRTCRRCRRCR